MILFSLNKAIDVILGAPLMYTTFLLSARNTDMLVSQKPLIRDFTEHDSHTHENNRQMIKIISNISGPQIQQNPVKIPWRKISFKIPT